MKLYHISTLTSEFKEFPNSFAFINATMGTIWTLQDKNIPS